MCIPFFQALLLSGAFSRSVAAESRLHCPVPTRRLRRLVVRQLVKTGISTYNLIETLAGSYS